MRRIVFLLAFVLTAAPALAQTIGPDAAGYTGVKTVGGSTFVSIVGAGGTRVTNALGGGTQDDVTLTVNAGFNFPFYGTTFSTFNVSTNGFVAFGGNTGSGSYFNTHMNGSSSATGTTITASSQGGPSVERAIVALYWDDLYFTNSVSLPGGLYAQTRTVDGKQELVLEYDRVQYFNATANSLTFQGIFRDDGTITVNYPDTSGPAAQSNGQSASLGIHDLNGGGAANRFLSFGFNTSSIASGDRIVYSPVPEPATVGLAAAGVLAAGGWVRRRRA